MRDPTLAEIAFLQTSNPNLVVSKIIDARNHPFGSCLDYACGDPAINTLDALDRLIGQRNWTRVTPGAADATIDIWGDDDGTIHHATANKGGGWASVLGTGGNTPAAGALALHNRNGFAGGGYGKVIASIKKSA